jgi:chromosome segregation ATPase
MRTNAFVSAIALMLLLLLTAGCRINQRARSETLIKHAANADEDAVKLQAKIKELKTSIDRLESEFEKGAASDVPTKVTNMQIQAERLEEQSEGLSSELRELAGEIARQSEGDGE